jgi:pyruvate kinase
MIHAHELDADLAKANAVKDPVPLYFDIKGRQLRVTHVYDNKQRLELDLNHQIEVETPTMVLFKGGNEPALLEHIKDGTHLYFRGGPAHMVYAGESMHIRHPSLQVKGNLFTPVEIEKIKKANAAGFSRYCLSYTQSQRDVDEFREHIGDSHVILKIEDKRGLEYVEREWHLQKNTSLMAACGDLYVEVDRPHNMMAALDLIIKKDPSAMAGSRMLLSLMRAPVPDLADFLQLSWLYDHGYRQLLLCDEICLKEELLARAVNAVESFSETYIGQNIAPRRSFFSRMGW